MGQGGGREWELLKKMTEILILGNFYLFLMLREFCQKNSGQCQKTATFWCQRGRKMKIFLKSSYWVV